MLINHCSNTMHCVATICNEDWHWAEKNNAMLPFNSFALSQFLRAVAAKTCASALHRSYRCYIYVTPLVSVTRNYRNVCEDRG